MLTSGFCIYIATNTRNGALYTGHTDDRLVRAEQHRLGTFGGFSQRYNCKHIVWCEEFASRDEAFVRERRIKDWCRKWKLELIEAFNPHWIDVVAAPVWPLPDVEMFPELYERCMAFTLER